MTPHPPQSRRTMGPASPPRQRWGQQLSRVPPVPLRLVPQSFQVSTPLHHAGHPTTSSKSNCGPLVLVHGHEIGLRVVALWKGGGVGIWITSCSDQANGRGNFLLGTAPLPAVLLKTAALPPTHPKPHFSPWNSADGIWAELLSCNQVIQTPSLSLPCFPPITLERTSLPQFPAPSTPPSSLSF